MAELHKHINKNVLEQLFLSRFFMALWIFLVYIGAMILQYTEELPFYDGLFFSFLMVICGILQWISSSLTDYQVRWLLFVYGGLIFVASFILPLAGFAIQIGLLPVWIAQNLMIYKSIFKPVGLFILMYSVFYIIVGIYYGVSWISNYMAIFFLVLASSIPFSLITKRQLHAHIRMQNYLTDLEAIHQKVEELTVANERQRMARDLHDTLAQGLAGLIMQLEATDVYLLNGNTKRSQEIIRKSMQQARKTLNEARQAIDDLRANTLSEMDFFSIIEREIEHFTEVTGVQVISEILPIESLSSLVKEHSLYMLSECLTNIAKHAKADQVTIKIAQEWGFLSLIVKDNGVGMDTNTIGKQPGHYGLIGLKERTRLLRGSINISSQEKQGTSIEIKLPVQEKGAET